jgi:hypothetical protein
MAVQEITSVIIDKGTDFSVSFLINAFDGNPLDLSSYTPVAKIRKYPSSPSYATFNAVTLGAIGYISLHMDKDDTQNLKTGRNYFDVILTNEFETIKAVRGTIMVEGTSAPEIEIPKVSTIQDPITNYAQTAGISTVAQGLTGTPNITVGIITATSFVGNLTGNSNAATYSVTSGISTNVIGGIASITSLNVTGPSSISGAQISGGIVTATKFVGDGSELKNLPQISSVGFSTTATNLAVGTTGSLPYQLAPGVTTFLPATITNNQVLLYNTGTNKPYWGDISSGSGAYNSIIDLQTAPQTGASLVKQYYVNYSEVDLTLPSPLETGAGGGWFQWEPNLPKSLHDGGLFISPTVPYDGTRANLVNFLNKIGETSPGTNGVWRRVFSGNVMSDWFGCVSNRIADDYPSIQKALDVVFAMNSIEQVGKWFVGKTNVVQISGNCKIKRYLDVGARITIYGERNTLVYPQQDSSFAGDYNVASGPSIYVDRDCELFRPTTYNCAVVLRGDASALEGITVDGYEMTYGSWYPIIKIATSPAGVGGSYAFNGELHVIDPNDPKQKKILSLETAVIPSHQFGDAWYPGFQLKAMGGNATGIGVATSTYTSITPANPYQWDVVSGTIPTGFAVSKSGWVTCDAGTAQIGKQFVKIQVADASGATVQKDLVLEVTGKYIELPLSDIPPATINQAYKYSFNVLNNDGIAHYWWLIDGPSGLTMNQTTGEITGTPPANAFGKYTLKIAITSATNTVSFDANTLIDEIFIDFTVENTAFPSMYGSLPEARLGVVYSGVLYPVGGVGPFTWEIDVARSAGGGNNQPGYPTATQPAPGLTLSTDGIRGFITGTSTTSGNFSFFVKFTDSTGKIFGTMIGFNGTSWTVRPQLKTSLIWNLPSAVAGHPYSYQVEATVDGCTFSAKSLPSGLTISSSGLISGIPVGGKYANGIACEWSAKLDNFMVRNFKGGAGVLVDGPSNVHIFRNFFINSCDTGISSDNMYDSRMESFYIYNTRIGLQMRGGTAACTYINGRIEYIHEHGVTALFSPDNIWSGVYWDTCGFTNVDADRSDNWAISNCFFFRNGRRIPPRGKYYMPDSPPQVSTHINAIDCKDWVVNGAAFVRGCDSGGSSSTPYRRYESDGRRLYIRPYTCLTIERCKNWTVNGNALNGCTRASVYSIESEFDFVANEVNFSGNTVQIKNQFGVSRQGDSKISNLLINPTKANFDAEGTEDNIDTYFPSTSLVLNGHEFTDRSSRSLTLNNTNVSISTSVFKFGTGSFSFNGTTSLLTPSVSTNNDPAAPFYFGTGDFDLDLLVYPLRNNVVQTLIDFGATSEAAPFALILDANGKLALAKNRSTGGQTIDFTSTRTIPTNIFSRITMSRFSGVVRIYIDETPEATLTTQFSGRFIVSGFNRPIMGRGGFTGATDFFQGYMQMIRVDKSISRYGLLKTLKPFTRPYATVNNGSLPPDTLFFTPASTQLEHFFGDRGNSIVMGPSASIQKPLRISRLRRNDLVKELIAGNGSYASGQENPSYYYYNIKKDAETGVTSYTFQTCEIRTWAARVGYPEELDRLRKKSLLLVLWARSNNRNPVTLFTQFYAGTSGNNFRVDGGFFTKFTLTPFWRKYVFQIKAPDYDRTLIDPSTSNALFKFYFDDKSVNYDLDFGGLTLYEDDGKFGFSPLVE